MGDNCWSPNCPTGTFWIGGGIQQCCPNTQSNQYWTDRGGCGNQAEEPDPGPGPGDPPPPPCTPPAAGWGPGGGTRFTNPADLNPDGGDDWDPNDGIYVIRTNNTDGKYTVSWGQPYSEVTTTEYRFIPSDVNGVNVPDSTVDANKGCQHIDAKCSTVTGSTTSMTFRPRRNRYYRLNIRFRNGCGAGSWSAWRQLTVRVDGQITGQIYTLTGSQAASPTGLNGACVPSSGTPTAWSNAPVSVVTTGDGYTATDSTINSNGRYRIWHPYQNPVSTGLNLSVTNLPAGYVVACPAGGTYTTIPAPFLSNGFGGSPVDASFYLCNAGTTTTPTTANITTPATNGAVLPAQGTAASPTVNLNFTRPVGYEVLYRVRPASNPVGQECGAGSHCGTATPVLATTATMTFTPSTANYVVDIAFRRTACGSPMTTGYTAARPFTVTGQITGTVYDDPTGVGNNNFCRHALFQAPLVTPLAAGSITWSGVQGNFTVNSSGTYTISGIPWGAAATTVTYNGGNPPSCGCPNNCVYGTVALQSTGVNFYRTVSSDSWWQVQGGPVLALTESGPAISSSIPDTCTTPTCQPSLITRAGGIALTSGYVVTGGGTVDLKRDVGDQVEANGASLIDEDNRGILVNAQPAREDFDTFVRRYKLPQTRVNDFDGVSGHPNLSNAAKPNVASHTPANGVAAYWAGGNMTIDQPWNVAANESIVIFVNGNLTLEDQANITVAQGGFLAFIVSGNIEVTANLGTGTASSVTPVVTGVFIADGAINVASRAGAGVGDLKFVGAGSFVGWGGVNLNRTFSDGGAGGASNNSYPSELFIYRPDFLLNAPDEMRLPRYKWQEVAP